MIINSDTKLKKRYTQHKLEDANNDEEYENNEEAKPIASEVKVDTESTEDQEVLHDLENQNNDFERSSGLVNSVEEKIEEFNGNRDKNFDYAQSLVRCEVCDMKLMSKHSLRVHRTVFHNCIKCDDCEIHFDTEKDLRHHIRRQHRKSHVRSSHNTQSTFREHTPLRKEKHYSHTEPESSSRYSNGTDNTQKYYSKRSTSNCQYCPRSFNNNMALKMHLDSKHSKSNTEHSRRHKRKRNHVWQNN